MNRQRPTIAVDYLANHANLVGKVAHWLHEEWYRGLGEPIQESAARVRQRLNRERIPLTLVALADDEPAGTVSLIEERHPFQREWVYCLAALFVGTAWRQRGIGTRLCREAMRQAQRLQLPRLYLYTQNGEDFYRRLGWKKIANPVIIMGSGFELVTLMTVETATESVASEDAAAMQMSETPVSAEGDS